MSPWVAWSRADRSSAIDRPITVSQSSAVVVTVLADMVLADTNETRLFNQKAEEALGLAEFLRVSYTLAAAPSVADRYHHQLLADTERTKGLNERSIRLKLESSRVLHKLSAVNCPNTGTLAVSEVYPYHQLSPPL